MAGRLKSPLRMVSWCFLELALVKKVLDKLFFPLDHSRRINSPSNFRFSQKNKKIKFVF